MGFGFDWTDADVEAAVGDATNLLSEDGVICYPTDSSSEPGQPGRLSDGTPVEVCIVGASGADLVEPGQVVLDPLEFTRLALQLQKGGYEYGPATTVKGAKIDLNP